MLGKGLESLIPQNSKPSEGSPPIPTPGVGESPITSTDGLHTPEPTEPAFSRAFQDAGQKEKMYQKPGGQESIFHIEVENIRPNPFQPRRDFSEDSLRELANSIREFGILQPLLVRKIEKEIPSGTAVEYELIAGERRLLASKLLGLERVPVIVKRVDIEKDRLEMAIIENLQRENLNPMETARAFSRLQDEFRLTQREIASRLGKSREVVANAMRLLDLPTYIQDAIAKGEISESHGRLLLAITDKSAQEKIFRDLKDNSLTTRELKQKVEFVKSGNSLAPNALKPELPPELKMFQERLSSHLGAPVEIKPSGNAALGSGRITITFYSDEELKNILGRLAGEEDVV